MKHFYFSIILLFFVSQKIKAQVYQAFTAGPTYWEERFESMTALNSPTGGWLTNTGGFSIQVSPHEFEGAQALSKEITSTNPGVDSVLTPMITNAGIPLDIRFWMRITNWIGSVPSSSAFTMPTGDTCYFSVVKYKNYAPVSETVIYKRSGYSSLIGFAHLAFPTGSYLVNTDTVRFKIKIKHGAASNYWIDLDHFLFVVPVGIAEVPLETANVFPNPVSDHLYLRLSGNEVLESVAIKNELGGEVLVQHYTNEANVQKLDLQLLPQGLYIAEITSKNGRKWVKKILRG